MFTKRTASAVLFAIAAAAPSLGATTWLIDQPWDFYTANQPPQTRLVGSITFDSAISNYYPASWEFNLVHFDPNFAGHYPLTISGVYPNVSDASGIAWTFYRDPFTAILISFGASSSIVDVLQNGTQSSVTFAANEYVQFGPFSSQRLIYAGTATLVPTPGAAALLGLAAMTALRRRRA